MSSKTHKLNQAKIIDDFITVSETGMDLPAFYSGSTRIPYKYVIRKNHLITVLKNKIRYWYSMSKNYYRGVVEYVIDNGKVDEVILCPNNCNDVLVVTGNTVPLEYRLSKPSNATIVLPTDNGDVSFVIAPNELHAKKLLKFKDYIIEV